MDSFGARSGGKSMSSGVYWPDDPHISCKFVREPKVDVELGMRGNGSVPRMGSNGYKSIGGWGRGLQHGTGEGVDSGRVTQPFLSLAQALATVLPPTKIQMHKCGRCGREFCCFMNYRRHTRSHRHMLHGEKEDLRNERQSIAAFLSKLPDDDFKRILDVNYKIEDICGVTAMRGLERFVHVPSFGFYAHNYFKSGSALHDTVQKQQVSSAHELLNILDEATEKTFLSGSTSESVVRYMLEGASGKTSLDDKMHIASVAFLVEHNLVRAWISAKSEQAKLVQEALEKEEDEAQRRQEAISEKKRTRRLKHKEKRALTEETGAEELRSDLQDGEAESCPKALPVESSPKGSEKLGSEPKEDRVSEPLAEAREVTEDFQDSGGWQKQGKVRWGDMVEPTHNRRNWSRNSRQDIFVTRGNAFSQPVMNGMKPEQGNLRPRPKPQRVTTGMPPGARPTPVKLPSNVMWARKMPADSGREDARSPTLLSAAKAPSDTSQSAARAPRTPILSATKVATPSTGLSGPPHAATGVSGAQASPVTGVEPFLPPVTGASAVESAPAPIPAPATAVSAPTSAPEAPGADGSAQDDGMNVMMVGTLKVPWSASTQGFKNELVTSPEAAALKDRKNDLVTPAAVEKAEGRTADQTGSSSLIDVQPTVPSELRSEPEKAESVGASSNAPQRPASSTRSSKNKLADQVSKAAPPDASSTANVPQREVAPASSIGSSKTVVQEAETVAAGQAPSPGPGCSTNASSRKAVSSSCKNELVTSTAVERAESVAADRSPEAASPEAVEKAESVAADGTASGRPGSPTASEHQITYEEFMCKRWDAAFADPNAVVLKLDHKGDAGPDRKTRSR